MTIYELETGTLGFIEFPKNTIDCQLRDENKTLSFGWDNGITREYYPMSDGYIPLGIFSQLKEEDVKEVMPKYYNGHNEQGFPYYELDGTVSDEINVAFVSALESIHSLAQHLGLNAVNPYGEKPKQGIIDKQILLPENYHKIVEWQEAQSKVKQYFVVFKPKQ